MAASRWVSAQGFASLRAAAFGFGALGLAAGAAAPAAAQSDTVPGPEAEPPALTLPPDAERRYVDAIEFRRRYENKTVHLTAGDHHYGSEYYLPGDRTVWIGDGGPCQKGVWAYVSPQICFQYEASGPHCWTVFDSGDTTYALSVDGLLLEVYAVDERPLTCDPELFS